MVVPSLVPYDFVNVGIEAEAFHREGVEILGVAGEGKVTEGGPSCLYPHAFSPLDLMLKEITTASKLGWLVISTVEMECNANKTQVWLRFLGIFC